MRMGGASKVKDITFKMDGPGFTSELTIPNEMAPQEVRRQLDTWFDSTCQMLGTVIPAVRFTKHPTGAQAMEAGDIGVDSNA